MVAINFAAAAAEENSYGEMGDVCEVSFEKERTMSFDQQLQEQRQQYSKQGTPAANKNTLMDGLYL